MKLYPPRLICHHLLISSQADILRASYIIFSYVDEGFYFVIILITIRAINDRSRSRYKGRSPPAVPSIKSLRQALKRPWENLYMARVIIRRAP